MRLLSFFVCCPTYCSIIGRTEHIQIKTKFDFFSVSFRHILMKYFCVSLGSNTGKENHSVWNLREKEIVVSILSPFNWFWSCGKRRKRNLWFVSHRLLIYLCLAQEKKHLIIIELRVVQVHLKLKWKTVGCVFYPCKLLVISFFFQSLIKACFFDQNCPKSPIFDIERNCFFF